MRRRAFLRLGVGAAAVAAGGHLPAGAGGRAVARAAQPAGPYGPLRVPDANGLRLPEGFSSRLVAVGGRPVAATGHTWHPYADGGATFAAPDGGWVYASNSEVSGAQGGVGCVRFAPDGEIVDAYTVLEGTSLNCAGGPTPWGTWLSCEEFDGGRVWECDPLGEHEARPVGALGTFAHEAAAVDPATGRVYLTEDRGDSRLYRFTPERPRDGPASLDRGVLEVAAVDGEGAVRWLEVPDPSGRRGPTRGQVPESTVFRRGEGAWFGGGQLVFCTTADGRVWSLDPGDDRLRVVYHSASGGPLNGVDNVTVAASGDVYVAEDGGNMELVLLTPDGGVVPFLRIEGQAGSEVAGPAFSPDGTRLYVSSQRGAELGLTYEITGPFRRPAAPTAPPTSTAPSTTAATTATTATTAGADPAAAPARGAGEGDGDGGGVPAVATGGALAALGGAAAALAAARRRSSVATDEPS